MIDPPHNRPVPPEPYLYENPAGQFIQYLQALEEAIRKQDLCKTLTCCDTTLTTGKVTPLVSIKLMYWIKREHGEGRKHKYQVVTIRLFSKSITMSPDVMFNALVQWEMYNLHISSRITTNAVLRLIAREEKCLQICREQFETAFLQVTTAESETFLAENPVFDYLKKAEEHQREEEFRVERYLHAKTRKDLVQKCEHVLIRAHSKVKWDSFQSLLDSEEDEDLQRMYALLSRIPEGLEPLRKRFEVHLKQASLTAASKLVGEGDTNTDSIDPKVYVDALLEVHHKNSESVQRRFRGDAKFAARLDKACREFVNRNAE